jgi:hypothetical protein
MTALCMVHKPTSSNSWSRVLLEKPPVAKLLKNFLKLYGPRRFINVFTRALHWSLSWAKWIHFIPFHPISLIHILICIPLFSHACYMPCRSNHPLLHSNYIWRTVQVMKLSSCNFLHPPIISPLLGSNIFLSTPFSNTFSLCSSLNVSEQADLPPLVWRQFRFANNSHN